MQHGTLLAGIDLGSNSFRLEIGRTDGLHVERVEYHKETVRQGSALDDERRLSVESMQRGAACLARFGERLRGFEAKCVKAVATQTLREASNRAEFLQLAEVALGFPIEVVSGREEARLIYQGVSRNLPQSDEQRLVIDVGGRSTELILGQRFESTALDSYRLGSVSFSERFFKSGFTHAAFEEATQTAKSYLGAAASTYGAPHWKVAYGSSGTVGAVAAVLGCASFSADAIEHHGLDWLRTQLIRAKLPERVRLEGLKDDRKAVIAGGIAVLQAAFEVLGIRELQVAKGALRHGLLYDLLARDDRDLDIREHAVSRMMVRFRVDSAQAHRVEASAHQFSAQLHANALNTMAEGGGQRLRWAAHLHEIGAVVSPENAHKHGAYVLQNADVAGFSVRELEHLAALVLGSRGKLKKIQPWLTEAGFLHDLMCLRLALLVCHARIDAPTAACPLGLTRRRSQDYHLTVPTDWGRRHAQTLALLHAETQAWAKVGLDLGVELVDD